MTWKQYALLAVLIALVISGTFSFLLSDDRPGITRVNYNRICNGMTHEQVRDLFGGEPGDMPGMGRPWAYTWRWKSKDLSTAFVTFQHGKVVDKEWRGSTVVALEEIIERIKR